MAVSKRLRSEIFRRDNSTCRYCGAKAPEVKITIDHVIPITLGGSDDPSNLVTACAPCNSGKTSVPPDAPLVADVQAKAIRWAEAQKRAAAAMSADLQRVFAQRERFREEWDGWTWDMGKQNFPLPSGWEDSVDRLLQAGVSQEILAECVAVAMRNDMVGVSNKFRYMCGVAWNKAKQIQEQTREFIGEAVPEPSPVVDAEERPEGQEELFRAWNKQLEMALTDTEYSHYQMLAEGALEWIGRPVIHLDVLTTALAFAEVEGYGRRWDLVKEHLEDSGEDGARVLAQALREWQAVDSRSKADDPEVLDRAVVLLQKEEELSQAMWSYFHRLSANEKDSWIRYCSTVFNDDLEEGPRQIQASKVAYEVSEGGPLPNGMCVVAESNIIGVCFNRAAFRATFVDCPACAEECTGRHQVCEHHFGYLAQGFRTKSGAVLTISDFKNLEAEE